MSIARTPEITGEPSTIEFTLILRLTYGYYEPLVLRARKPLRADLAGGLAALQSGRGTDRRSTRCGAVVAYTHRRRRSRGGPACIWTLRRQRAAERDRPQHPAHEPAARAGRRARFWPRARCARPAARASIRASSRRPCSKSRPSTRRAVSWAGAAGIGQFMVGTADGYGIDPFEPGPAIDATARLLATYLARVPGAGGRRPLRPGPRRLQRRTRRGRAPTAGCPPTPRRARTSPTSASAGRASSATAEASGRASETFRRPAAVRCEDMSSSRPVAGSGRFALYRDPHAGSGGIVRRRRAHGSGHASLHADAQVFLRRFGFGAVRGDHAAAGILPHPRRARSARDLRRARSWRSSTNRSN